MVNKLWFRELSRKWSSRSREAPEPPAVRRFTEAGCDVHSGKLHGWYLLYRWAILAVWLTIVVCSVFEYGSVRPKGHQEKWPIYLTNWDLTLGSIQALLGAMLVTKRWRLQNAKSDFDATSELKCSKLVKVYWFFYTVTTTLAMGVTLSYWILVHNPKEHDVDTLNILIHVVNSVLVTLDFVIGSVPFELRCFWWTPLVVVFYVTFSLVYYLAGGVGKNGKSCIYPILDWENPLPTMLTCIGGIVYLAFNHCLLCCLSRFRDRLYLDKFESLEKDEKVRSKTGSTV